MGGNSNHYCRRTSMIRRQNLWAVRLRKLFIRQTTTTGFTGRLVVYGRSQRI